VIWEDKVGAFMAGTLTTILVVVCSWIIHKSEQYNHERYMAADKCEFADGVLVERITIHDEDKRYVCVEPRRERYSE